MVDKDLLIAKASALMKHFERVQEKSDQFKKVPKEIDQLESLLFNLVQAVQLTVDLAHHLIADQKWGVANSYVETFQILEQQGVVESSLAEGLIRLIRFRNLVVHEYLALDNKKLQRLFESDFPRLEAFVKTVLKWGG